MPWLFTLVELTLEYQKAQDAFLDSSQRHAHRAHQAAGSSIRQRGGQETAGRRGVLRRQGGGCCGRATAHACGHLVGARRGASAIPAVRAMMPVTGVSRVMRGVLLLVLGRRMLVRMMMTPRPA